MRKTGGYHDTRKSTLTKERGVAVPRQKRYRTGCDKEHRCAAAQQSRERGRVRGHAPGPTQAELFKALLSRLPGDPLPGGAKANWWAKRVQLDLEAKRLVVRENTFRKE